MTRPLVLIAVCLFGGLCRPLNSQAQTTPMLEQYLNRVGMGTRELAAARDRAIAKRLATKDNRDVTVFGMVGVKLPRDTTVTRISELELALTADLSRHHPFGDPPSAEDLRAAAFAESEYRDARDCRPGECGFKLPASLMKDFADQVDWSSREAKSQADARLRAALLDFVTDYARRGDAAMPVYADGRSVRAGDAFAALLDQSSDLQTFAPALKRYLSSYPQDRPDGTRDFFYWSEDRLPRLRPTITLNHAVVYDTPGRDGEVFLARKQIYANNYFEGALEWFAVMDGLVVMGEPVTYLVTVRRFRFDNLPHGLFNVRGRVRRQLVDATRADLERRRSALRLSTP